ncbi:MAG: hypothetical protein NZ602_04530 [Thermoguttaceae bacterium]|nr:hypothetical protein [Thermoguttaceae bacterium]MDW8036614.1 hypothetical protein [Thermoguttaceae bacterium]
MKFSDLVVLLPGTSLEDLRLDWPAAEAEEILSAYSALWHPMLVASAGSMPRWAKAEDPPQGPEGALVVVPPVSESRLPSDWLSQTEGWGLCVVRGLRHRAEIISAALQRLADGSAMIGGLCPELVADFLALGYAHFVTELVTRQIRYMSNLDEVRLSREVVAAAQAALGGQPDLAHDHLRAALDTLVEARHYYYPAETYLLDVTVVARSTLGAALQATLQTALEKGWTTNLLLGAVELEQLAQQAPEMVELLRKAWSEKKLGILAGGKDESPLGLLPLEAMLENIQEGLTVFERLLGQRPKVFGRRRYGLSPVLPQILAGLGLEGVLHGALDEGRFPTSHQSKIRWEGLDGTTLEGLGRVPLDAAKADSFLRIVRLMGDTLEWDSSNMVMLAHWPGPASAWLDDLHRIDRYSSAVGRFVTVEDYLEQTRYAGQQRKYGPDEYRSPYLRQEVARQVPDPISRWVYYHRLRSRWEQLRSLRFLLESLTGLPAEQKPLATLQEAIRTVAAQEGPFHPEHWPTSLAHRQAIEDHLESACQEILSRLAQVLYPDMIARPSTETGSPMPQVSPATKSIWQEFSAHSDTQGQGEERLESLLMVNPASFSRQIWFSAPAGTELGSLEGIRFAGRQQGQLQAVCELPGMGFVRVEIKGKEPESFTKGQAALDQSGSETGLTGSARSSSRGQERLGSSTSSSPNTSSSLTTHSPTYSSLPDELLYPPPKQLSWVARFLARKRRPLPPLAEEHLLRNEFFEARLDPATGALRGVYTYGSRRPRCAQQLALRIPCPTGQKGPIPDEERNYTLMAADGFRVLSAGPLVGQLEVQGRLMTPQGQVAARFLEIFRCRRGHPVLEILIHLEPLWELEADPWNSYYACRFAWGDQTAELFRSVNQLTCRSEADRLETPWFVDLRTDKHRTTFLFGGLPYHRRIGVNKLDTILIVRGETARQFRVGIGVDLKHPMCAAWDFLAPALAIPLRRNASQQTLTTSTPTAGWFFHLNVRNVLATAWESLVEAGQVRGFRVRLAETEGRNTTALLHCLRPVASAAQVDFTGKHIRDLTVKGDTIHIPVHGYQYLQLEARYAGISPESSEAEE